jgi:hypothetical protein
MDSKHNSAMIIHPINVGIAADLEMGVFRFCLAYKQLSKVGMPFQDQLWKTNSLRVTLRANAFMERDGHQPGTRTIPHAHWAKRTPKLSVGIYPGSPNLARNIPDFQSPDLQ